VERDDHAVDSLPEGVFREDDQKKWGIKKVITFEPFKLGGKVDNRTHSPWEKKERDEKKLRFPRSEKKT